MGKRCNWVRTEADAHYHDTEWGARRATIAICSKC
ncbi:hypothetical protein B7760_02988 [Burkholderia glumae]|nr:hypothetical protein B7760_02988 [Burkholderia glumae]